MALPTDTTTFDLPQHAAPQPAVDDETVSVADPSGQNPLGVVVAAAAAGPQTDLTVLDLQDLLRLRLDDDGPTSGRSAASGDGAGGHEAARDAGLAQLLATADLPADLTALDLDQVLGLDLSGNALPTVLEVAELPADLTALELAQLLGLSVAGDALPTIKEVIQLAVRNFEPARGDNQAAADDANNAQNERGQPHGPASDGPSSRGENLSFLDSENSSQQAEHTTHAAEQAGKSGDTATGQTTLHGNHFGADWLFQSSFDAELRHNVGTGANANNGGGGGGTNVINGTSGDDMLTGTAGSDLINGKNGNDTIDGGAGDDKLHGQNGNDTLIWDAADSQVKGGSGDDTLQVNSGNVDLTAFGGVISGIENIDLATDFGANTLTLTAQDVLDLSDTNTLTVTGDGLDTVSAGIAGWVDGGTAGGYHTYTQVVGPDTATLIVDQTIMLV